MRVVLCFLIILVAAPALAEWIRWTSEGSDVATGYIDPTKVRRDGSLVRIWEVLDYKKPDAIGGLSTRFLAEYDCKEERVRNLSVSGHSGPMATGKILISSESPSEWKNIPPNTGIAALLKTVCMMR